VEAAFAGVQRRSGELFDLAHDPGELKNLYGDESKQAVRDELQSRLDAWMRSIADPVVK
jgi:hypothetical protein